MVLAYHAIWSAQGFWLPNDPRGSWSTQVWAKHLRPFGEATKTNIPRSLANRKHDSNARREAKKHLLFPAVTFNGLQARAIARGFDSILPVIGVRLYACAIMPDHVHIVAVRHPKLLIEEIVGFLKRAATRRLTREDIHPLSEFRRQNGRTPSPWVDGGWHRYLNSRAAIGDAVDYVWKNPARIGLPGQPWWFIVPFQ